MKTLRVVSVSGGKDSTATLLLALETNWTDDVRAAFADTGNEHEITLEYLDYLEVKTGVKITRLSADLSERVNKRRESLLRIAAGEPESVVYKGVNAKTKWTAANARKAAEFMHPTGNPFLDACLMRGGFPRRMRQYCTQELKVEPLEKYQMGLLPEAGRIESWQGIRADESNKRSSYPDYEWGPKWAVNRPILRWGVERVFEQHRRHGVRPNPLYSMGMKRVGCMPCINASKQEIAQIARRFPEHIERIAAWEALIKKVAREKNEAMPFFHAENSSRRGIHKTVTWAKTTHGGKQYDLLGDAEDVTMCSSEYGLCE